jgi:hypothetical protein
MNKVKTTIRAVRQQWDARIELFKKTMGWEDSHCQNLSGFEGDLSEPDATRSKKRRKERKWRRMMQSKLKLTRSK